MVFYSLGTFHLSPPYRWRHRIYRFPNSNITDHMMHVELSYNLNPNKMLIMATQPSRNAAEWFSSAWPGPAAILTGNNIKRKSALIEFKMSQWSKDINKIIHSSLFDVLKQLTVFKIVTLRLEVIRHARHWGKWYAGFMPLLNDLSGSLEPALGYSTIREPETAQEWPMSRNLYQPYVTRKVEFHPRDHLAKMSKMKDIVPHEAEQVIVAEADQLSHTLQGSS